MANLFKIKNDSFGDRSREEIKTYVFGAYNKFKHMIYYNSSYLIYKKRIAQFEYKNKEEKLYALVDFLYGDLIDIKYFENLTKKIDYYPVIKKEEKENIALNYFIDIPIEIHIIDVIWTILKGLSFEDEEVEKHWFGNLLDKANLYKEDANDLNDILWDSSNLFKKYVIDYNNWINRAVACFKEQKSIHKDVTLITTDLSRYYYSTNEPFSRFRSTLHNSIIETYLNQLTIIMKEVYSVYNSIIKNITTMKLGDCILPIGLTSSMLMANTYLSEFDKMISNISGVQYYGRYVDDIIIVMNKNFSEKDAKEMLKSTLIELNYSVEINSDKTNVFPYHNYNFHTEIERLINYLKEKTSNYNRNEDQESISFRRYFAFEKDLLTSNLIENGVLTENAFASIDVTDSILFMNYIYDLIEFDSNTLEDIYQKIVGYIRATTKFTMWKEIYRWINIFKKNQRILEEVHQLIKEKYELSANKEILDINDEAKAQVKKHLIDTYENINDISKVLGGIVEENRELDVILDMSGMCRRDSIIKYLIINYRKGNKIYDNTTSFYKKYYKNTIPFIHLWEVILFDQLVNLSKKNKKTYQESIDTFKEINNIEYFDYIGIKKDNVVGNVYGSSFMIEESVNFIDYTVSHPNINLDDNKKSPLTKKHKIPRTKDTRVFIRNLLASIENKTNTLILPELYVKLEWLKILAQIAHYNSLNVTFGLENIVLGKRYYNVIISLYSFKDYKMRKNVFATVREKNFYSYDEMEWCQKPKIKLTCRNPKYPVYFLVKNKGISFADYLCFEITDIYSRALFKGEVNVVLIPMLNRDTAYFDNIIQSLSRDLSCCVMTSNSASWGNSSIILPKASYEKVLTDFRGGFNNYLVSSRVPIYELIDFNKKFDWRVKNQFKKHPANFNYINEELFDLDKFDWD